MKKFKSGFSLAELLIAMAIVAIIITMALTISRKGISRAYNMYYYTGYIGISDAISDALNENITISASSDLSNSVFVKHIAKVLSAEVSNCGTGCALVKAPNNVKYKIRRPFFNPLDALYYTTYYEIRMTVPSERTNSDSDAKLGSETCFYFSPKSSKFSLIIPAPPTGSLACDGTVNLQDRRDLLPFYIDDGKVGRLIIPYDIDKKEFGDPDTSSYTRRKYMSFREAACKVYGTSYLADAVDYFSLTQVLSCDTTPSDPPPGILKVGNPKNLK